MDYKERDCAMKHTLTGIVFLSLLLRGGNEITASITITEACLTAY